ncbi:mitochondrial Complex V (CV) ATP synthase F1 complex assembly factor 2 (ATPAF2/Atp12) [Andalucia godoyi]|uniref:Mitochondrial Complex V (CV) ATP synthase F1 complex assembly factor 2 (ATPAF2/Atp12) n=1 Tax=Andalucia godoyi TaxID=505711 RepID=A0A8K0AJ21_ANDGO|nr:mitochondrial Complex V (CV) ATP synthase F1 complex assembly factor 2 (ATPAF2/Atp12) [Andalucia godoyi]|eukprot:ANDGO_00822.mRNA.1 mitochondrial Complex V (CV) ATP synthase F1 complex assembly factor 2 (ATPAF2/Atp12)
MQSSQSLFRGSMMRWNAESFRRRFFASSSSGHKLKKFYKSVDIKSIDSTSPHYVPIFSSKSLQSSKEQEKNSNNNNSLSHSHSHTDSPRHIHGRNWTLLLDGKTFRTPKRTVFQVPSESLALAIAGEWLIQGHAIEPSTMLLTTIGTSAIDLKREMPLKKDVDYLLSYLQTDTVCYRAPFPEALSSDQERTFAPIIGHMRDAYRVKLLTTHGLGHLQHPEDGFKNMATVLSNMSFYERTALEVAVTSARSFSIGMSLTDGFLNPDDAVRASRLEEIHQSEQWGADESGHGVDASDLEIQMRSAWLFTHLLRME